MNPVPVVGTVSVAARLTFHYPATITLPLSAPSHIICIFISSLTISFSPA